MGNTVFFGGVYEFVSHDDQWKRGRNKQCFVVGYFRKPVDHNFTVFLCWFFVCYNCCDVYITVPGIQQPNENSMSEEPFLLDCY